LLFDTVLLAVAVFFLFMLMSYLLFNPARKLLKDRQDRIESDINTAVADKESAAALKAEYEGKLKDIDKEAEAILTEARQKALKNQNKIVDDAKEEASRIIKRAREEAAASSYEIKRYRMIWHTDSYRVHAACCGIRHCIALLHYHGKRSRPESIRKLPCILRHCLCDALQIREI
jgi:F0F1-type ATP synthase membrane subunit b/b'